MLNFIDTSTGNVFNGSQPYRFWFDEGQSTGLNYVRNICIISEEVQLAATIDSDDSIFCFVDVTKFGDLSYVENINQRNYYNIDDLRLRTFISTGTIVQTLYGALYVHMFYILAKTDSAGEFLDSFTITGTNTNEHFLIGADFYNNDEVLQVNLSNLGIDIPTSIQKAIYDKTPYEESPDNILLNRKMKELLLNYWNIVANKGSYKSLIDSLGWFEYGDLVHLEDFWRHNETKTKAVLEGHELRDAITQDMLQQLAYKVKTTYLGLYLTLNKIFKEDGEVVYDDKEGSEIWYDSVRSATLLALDNNVLLPPSTNGRILQIGCNSVVNIDPNWIPSQANPNWTGAQFQDILAVYGFTDSTNNLINEWNPKLINIITKWNHVDLSLKMTLLGNFFSTYFMPIHLDLIHSTIDKLVFTTTIKILNSAALSRVDRIENHNPIDLDVVCDYKMKPINAYVYNDTLFHQTDEDSAYCGVETSVRNVSRNLRGGLNTAQVEGSKMFLKYHFGDFGCVAKFTCRMVDDGYIRREMITWRCGTTEEDATDFVRYDTKVYTSINNVITAEFEILFTEAKHYNIYFYFESSSGHTFTKHIELDVVDDTRQQINLFRVNRVELKEYFNTEHNDFYNELNMPNIIFQQQWANAEYGEYTQFLTATQKKDGIKSVGINSIFVLQLDIEGLTECLIGCKDEYEYEPLSIAAYYEDSEYFFNELITRFPHYWWDIQDRFVNEEEMEEEDPHTHPVLLGIRKAFTLDDEYYDGSNPHENVEQYGVSFYKIRLIGEAPAGLRLVDEDRFFPILHTIESLNKPRFINLDETIVCVPDFERSRTFDSYTWKFKNVSTGKEYESKVFSHVPFDGMYDDVVDMRIIKNQSGTAAALVDSYESDAYDWMREKSAKLLDPGYYNVELNYKVGNTINTVKLNSAFRINRE